MVEWKPIEEFPGYEVSSNGDVRRGAHIKEVRFDRKGYRKVSLSRDGKSHTRLISRLVAAAFIGPRPAGQVVRHRDGQNGHDVATNLRYGTPSENELDKREHGTAPIGENHPAAKLTREQVAAIRARYRKNSHKDGCAAIARDYGVTGTLIHYIVIGKLWK